MWSGEKLKPTSRNFLARYRVTPDSTTAIAPCELLLKRHLRTRLDLLQPISMDVQKGTSCKEKKPIKFTEGEKCGLETTEMGNKRNTKKDWHYNVSS